MDLINYVNFNDFVHASRFDDDCYCFVKGFEMKLPVAIRRQALFRYFHISHIHRRRRITKLHQFIIDEMNHNELYFR